MKNLFLIFAAAILVSCGGSSSNDPRLDKNLQVSASNVIFGEAQANVSKALDTEVQVLAKNVVIDVTTNRLTSTNLQSALDTEMEVDLANLLPGTTWNIENKTVRDYVNKTGQIIFGESTFSLTGDLGAISMIEWIDTCYPQGNINYELINSRIIYVSFNTVGGTQSEAVINIVVATPIRLVIIGRPTCTTGVSGASILTKIE